MYQLIQGKIVPQAIVNAAPLKWPGLTFAPINLWSFPAAWKREMTEFPPAPALSTQDNTASYQVNPLIRRIMSYR